MLRFFPQKNKYVEEASQYAFDKEGQIPQHIAIIMDGNGRWAQNRRLPRIAGHKEGMDTVKKITKHASHLGVKVLTLYAFSTENWKRPTDEVNFLMQLPVDFFDTFVPELIKENVKVNVMGYQEFLPSHTQDAVKRAIEQTKDNTGMVLNFALNYGARAELLTAMKQIAAEVSEKAYTADEITEETIADHLMTGFLPTELRDPKRRLRFWKEAIAVWRSKRNYRNRRERSAVRQRVITAIVALIIFIPIIWYGGFAIEIAAVALAVVGVYELFRMKGLTLLSFEGVLSALGAVFLVIPTIKWLNFLPEMQTNFILFYVTVMLLLGASVISKNTYTIEEAGFPVIVSLYVGMGFQNFISARSAGFEVLLFALFIVWATDIGAYLFGRRFGRHKLMPDVSPNKTIEGALGGILSAVVVAALFLVFTANKGLFPYPMPVMLVLTVLFSIVGQFGDLVESSIKRHYGVKDSGNILPGHGGILDRFDSLLFVFPIMHLCGLF